MPGPVMIVGAGGLGREVLASLRAAGKEPGCFLVEPGYATHSVAGLPVRDDAEAWASAGSLVVAIGDGRARARIVRAMGERAVYARVQHPAAILGAGFAAGEGSMLIGWMNATVDVEVGAHALINPGCTISHDCRVGPFASLGPQVVLAGSVLVEEGAALGAGAVVAPQCRIGAWAVVGAGAVVIRDVPPGARVAGVPARLLPKPSSISQVYVKQDPSPP